VSHADFLDILRVLVRHEVEFVVVGGLSAVFNGAPIVTLDVDILHRRTKENVARLLVALSELDAHYKHDPRRLRPTESHLLGAGHQLLRTRFGELDVLGTIDDDVTYEQVAEQTIEVELQELRVRALALSRLIQAKEFAGRPKDVAVLPVLRATLAEVEKRSRTKG